MLLALLAASLFGLLALQPAQIAKAACTTENGSFDAGGGTSQYLIGKAGGTVSASLSTSNPTADVYIAIFIDYGDDGTFDSTPSVDEDDGSAQLSASLTTDGLLYVEFQSANVGETFTWSVQVCNPDPTPVPGNTPGTSTGGSNSAVQQPPAPPPPTPKGPRPNYTNNSSVSGYFNPIGRYDVYGNCVNGECQAIAYVNLYALSPVRGGQTFDANPDDGWHVVVFYLGPSELYPNQGSAVYQVNVYANGVLLDDRFTFIILDDGKVLARQ